MGKAYCSTIKIPETKQIEGIREENARKEKESGSHDQVNFLIEGMKEMQNSLTENMKQLEDSFNVKLTHCKNPITK